MSYIAKAHGNVELEWAEDAQGKKMGQGCLRREKWVEEARKQWNGLRKPK